MKKKVIIFSSILVTILIVFLIIAFRTEIFHNPTPTPTPSPSSGIIAEVSPSPVPDSTPDPRNEESVIRSEIAALLRDAEELLEDGLLDDAGMVLRDLKTRTLTEAEKEQLDALQESMLSLTE